ncbi:MAG: AmmeMemoRadiSam system protein B [Nitrospiraceae bacterium]|nr:AmmeMemoRadiSam system protein B [Nitrospiraceae bacterium]
MIREAVAAGRFYPSDFGELDKSIEDAFKGDLGPAETPGKRRNERVNAVIVPHAGYEFSAQCAAWAYKEIGESHFPDTFVVLGPNHTGMGSSGISLSSFQTPFGVVLNDVELSKKISELSGIKIDELPHAHEHSIEVQLPLLQYSCKEKLNVLKIVPIVVSYDANVKKLGEAIYDAAKKLGRDVLVIVSSDFTHYGLDYGYYPYGLDSGAEGSIIKLEDTVIEAIKEKNVVNLMGIIRKTRLTICGIYPIYSLIYYLKKYESEEKKVVKGYVLQRYTSNKIMKQLFPNKSNDSSFVSYVSMVFKEQ